MNRRPLTAGRHNSRQRLPKPQTVSETPQSEQTPMRRDLIAAPRHPHITSTATIHLGDAPSSGSDTCRDTRIIPHRRGFSANANPLNAKTRERSRLGGTAGFSDRFNEELAEAAGPIHIPITADPDLFQQAVALGRDLLWRHTWSERFAPADQSRLPAGQAKEVRPVEGMPNDFAYDPESQTLTVGTGAFAPVSQEAWNFEVSGLRVLRSWLGYRMKTRKGKKSSPLDDIRPTRWTQTSELLLLLSIIEHTIEATPKAAALLDQIVQGPLIPAKDGDLHRWMRQIGHDGRLFKSASDPVEVHSMAQRLSSEERVRVDEMARAGVDVDEMARRLDRHRSTVHRELKRCGGRCGYDAEAAQAAADLRARRPKTPKLAGDPVLAAAVGGLLADRMSPHAISAQLRSEGHGICAETVYAACYDHSGARGLPEGSWKLLPRRCRKRRPRGRHARKPSPLGDFKAISQRPASVEDRRQPGHWEGDLIIGKANRSAVATLVERTSRQTLTVALPHGYDAHNTAAAVTAALARQPRHLVKTLTWDQGREMARWPDIEATLGIEVYFCDPHSPWQRPTNEQTNGLLRRWLPKSTDLNVGAVRLAIIEDHLNTMPRKLHDWNSAHSVYAALCRNHR